MSRVSSLADRLWLYHEWGVDEGFFPVSAPMPSLRSIASFAHDQQTCDPQTSFAETSSSLPLPVASPAAPSSVTSSVSPVMTPPVLPVSSSSLVPNGEASVRDIASLEDLRAFVDTFAGCDLKATAQTTVFSDGDPQSRVMLVGEAPGAEEDRQGKPFVGRSGQLLDQMLAAIGLDRNHVYIANIVPWRPPGNRVPTPAEIAACLPLIEKHIALVSPAVLVLLGNTAVRALLRSKEGITRMRGKPHVYQNPYVSGPIKTIVTFHPAYLLRSPLQKRGAWHDFLKLKHSIASYTGDRHDRDQKRETKNYQT